MRLAPLLVLVPCAALSVACGPAEGAARGTGAAPDRAAARVVAHGDVARTLEADADASSRAAAAALVAYADAALAVDDTAGARLHLRDALHLANDAATAIGLARVTEHVGDTAAAAESYRRYLALAPHGRHGATARARLRDFGVANPGPTDPAARVAGPRTTGAAASKGTARTATRGKSSRARGTRPPAAKRRVAASAPEHDSASHPPVTIAAETTLAAAPAKKKGPSRWVRVRNWVTHRGTVVGAAAGAAVGFAVGNVPGALVAGAATGRVLGGKPSTSAAKHGSDSALALPPPPTHAPRPTVPLGP